VALLDVAQEELGYCDHQQQPSFAIFQITHSVLPNFEALAGLLWRGERASHAGFHIFVTTSQVGQLLKCSLFMFSVTVLFMFVHLLH
jgi:hypothetical protein